jgi:hypothetical protein
MAKRKRAHARRSRATKIARRTRTSKHRTRKPPRRPRVPAHRTYTPELLANGRRRYEQTAEAVASIAADFRIHPGSLRRLGYRLGWVRYNMGPRELPPGARLLAQADALEAGALTLPPPTGALMSSSSSPERQGDYVCLHPPLEGEGAGGHTQAPLNGVIDSFTIDRLEKAVLEELTTVEAMRAQLKGLPRRPREAESTARTLSSLTETLQKLQRLRCSVPLSEADDDDMPADIDEFRRDLARRIDAFVASRTEPSEADGDRSAEQKQD